MALQIPDFILQSSLVNFYERGKRLKRILSAIDEASRKLEGLKETFHQESIYFNETALFLEKFSEIDISSDIGEHIDFYTNKQLVFEIPKNFMTIKLKNNETSSIEDTLP